MAGAEKAPAQLQGLLELQAAHAGAPVHEAPQRLVIAARQAHRPLVPAQHRQALQMEEPCMQHEYVLSDPIMSHPSVMHAGLLIAMVPCTSSLLEVGAMLHCPAYSATLPA